MKNVKKILLGLLICAVALIILKISLFYFGMSYATSHNYTDLEKTADGYDFLLRDGKKKAAVCRYLYDPTAGNTVIVIPENYGDYPVQGLGGYVGKGGPAPFEIEVKGLPVVCGVGLSKGSFDWYAGPKMLEIEYVDLTLHIGPNIREIHADQSAWHTGGRLVVVRVYVECDPGNPRFYSEDGVLYHKNGSVVEGFLYWNQDYM